MRKIFSRPVSSGLKKPTTSSKLATRPRRQIRPAVGSVIRLRIFKSVDLPAPFLPMIPSTSPGFKLQVQVPQSPEFLGVYIRPNLDRPFPAAPG